MEQFEDLEGEGADFPVGEGGGAHLYEVTPGADVAGDEYLGLGGVGQDGARGLPDGLAAVGVVVESLSGQDFLEFRDQLDVAVGGGFERVFQNGAGRRQRPRSP